jgi:hypothetical protein
VKRTLGKVVGCATAQLALLWAGVAFGEQTIKLDCSKSNYDSRCIWSSYGEPEIDSPETKGDAAIRVDGGVSLRPWMSIMVEFRHDSLGGNWMTFRDPASAKSTIHVPITEKTWETILARLKAFQSDQADFQVRHAKELRERKDTIVCMDSSGVSVDSSVDGTILHYEADSCENDSVYEFIDATRTLAYTQIPYCAEKQLQWPDLCLSLDGDKFSAAEVLVRFMAIDPGDCKNSMPSRSVLPLLAEDSEFRAPGLPVAKGKAAVADAWQSFICGMGTGAIGPWPKSVEGSHEEIRMVGSISGNARSLSPDSNKEVDYEILAESTILWKKDATGTFRIADWTVGDKVERKLW